MSRIAVAVIRIKAAIITINKLLIEARVSVCVCVRAHAKLLQSCLTVFDPSGLKPARLHCSWDSSGKNTAVGCCALL